MDKFNAFEYGCVRRRNSHSKKGHHSCSKQLNAEFMSQCCLDKNVRRNENYVVVCTIILSSENSDSSFQPNRICTCHVGTL